MDRMLERRRAGGVSGGWFIRGGVFLFHNRGVFGYSCILIQGVITTAEASPGAMAPRLAGASASW